MKRLLLVIAALLSLTVLMTACKKDGDTISTPAASDSTAAQATPAPTELPPYEANVLTGEPKGADYPEGQRITAVMVNNIVAARPQRGLSKADILFEIKVEGGITRFMPVFTDYKTIGEVGPVRSGRDQFFRLILPWQALYIHEGQSVVMQQYAIDFDYGKLNNNDGANGYRDYGRVNWAGKSYNNGTLALEHSFVLPEQYRKVSLRWILRLLLLHLQIYVPECCGFSFLQLQLLFLLLQELPGNASFHS